MAEKAWVATDDPTDPCNLCVQWRCAVNGVDCPDALCDYKHEQEPYWPDGSVVPQVFDGNCGRCTEAMEHYFASVERGEL